MLLSRAILSIFSILWLNFAAVQAFGQNNSSITGDSLTPWKVLSGPPPNRVIHIALGGHVSFPQPAIPARVIKLTAPLVLDGVALPADTPLALTMTTTTKQMAWCVLPKTADANATSDWGPVWGGSLFAKGFKTGWGKSTRCIADIDLDGLFETQLDGKFDSLGLPSVRRLTRPVKMAVPTAAIEGDPSNIQGFMIAATIIYSDVSRRRASACTSLMPNEIKEARPEIAKRFTILTLQRSDGTACFDDLDENLRPDAPGQLAAVVGQSLVNRGAVVLVENIDHNGVDVRLVQMFNSYYIATRTEQELDFEID